MLQSMDVIDGEVSSRRGGRLKVYVAQRMG